MSQPQPVSVGEEFAVWLEGSPTTGFRWEWKHDPTAGVELVRTATEPNLGVAGGRARQGFVFRSSRAGPLRLEFVYRRPWEETPRDRHTVEVRVA